MNIFIPDKFFVHPTTTKKSYGGGERVRTDDPLRARQVLSQLSYTPNKPQILNFGFSKKSIKQIIQIRLVGLDGIEPSTSRLSGVRSNRTELQAQELLDSGF